MSSYNASSTPTSGTTSATGQPSRLPESTDGPEPRPLPGEAEADYLLRQREQAKLAIAQAASQFTSALGQGLDPKLWTRQYPWLSLGAAAAAGFAAVLVMVPGREERALRRLERIESALMGDRKSKQDKGPPTTASQDYGARQFQKGRTSFVGALGRQLLEAVKPALMSALTAGITAKAATGKSDGQQGDSGATASRSTDPSAEI